MEELTEQLFEFYNGFSTWESSVIRASDLSVSEAHAIEILGEHGRMNMKTLAEKLGVTTGTTTVTVDRLERKDYARREALKEDRRVNLISLSEKGKQAFLEHHRYHVQLTEQIAAVLSVEEVTQLHSLLQKINREVF
ncbi:MarR family winged helix-turn-helix transcriptional regulator [Azotosporobacter soli]|uniref:MarR family winged helix-turn-helix transcriptional regulator n=1 Tax=Azotosporobacter soli TaxID=3055040 RepID=UPI0031FEEB5D